MEIIAADGLARYLADEVCSAEMPNGSFEQKLSSALRRWGVVKPDETLLSFEEWHNYQHLGGETYVAAAQVTVANSNGCIVVRPFVSKAVINGQETANRMLKRRAILKSHGILVPELYSVLDACIQEQFLPYSLQHHLPRGNAEPELLRDVIHTAAILDLRGFPTFNFILDMRTDGKRAHYVDFGWDLWDPADHPVSNAFTILTAFVQRHLPDLLDEVKRGYTFVRETWGTA